MLFFKHTMSYQFVTLLEQLEIRHMYQNIIIYLIKLFKLDYTLKRKIKKANNKEKIELFVDLFKDRFYLEHIKNVYNLGDVSRLSYEIINNNIICEIYYDEFHFLVECGIASNQFSIHIISRFPHKAINITEDSLKLESYCDLCMDALNLLYDEICIILYNIFNDTIKRMRKVRKNV